MSASDPPPDPPPHANPEQGAGAGRGGPPGARRVYYARSGAHVTVREVDTRSAAWARGPHCLVFELEGAIRRVWEYPADWADLPDETLDELSWRR
jgi:hypothetical protein